MKQKVQKKISLPDNADVWVLAGQSNMEGCGYLAGALKPDRRVFCFTTHHEWTIACDPLHDLVGSAAPVDWNLRKSMMPQDIVAKGDDAVRSYWHERQRGIGAGPGIAFGSAYAKATGRPVGLISSAHGGTSLAQWSQAKKDEGLNSLYGAMLERIRLAGGKLRGILWYQGESDTSPEAAATYRERFIEWVNAVRADVKMPNLPVITVQLGCVADTGRNPSGWEKIRDVQYDMPSSLANCAVTTSVDLGLNDTIHIDAPGQIRLGRRMARLALRIAEHKKDIPSGPRITGMVSRINDRGLGETDITFGGVAGELMPLTGIHGFSIHIADGQPHPNKCVSAAYRHPKKEHTVIVRTSKPLAPGDVVSYGRGLMPVCNLTDKADMPVCSFSAAVV